MGHGPWAMGPGPWAMGHGPWAMGPGPWALGHGPWAMGHGPPLRFIPVPVHTGSRLTEPGSTVPGKVRKFHANMTNDANSLLILDNTEFGELRQTLKQPETKEHR